MKTGHSDECFTEVNGVKYFCVSSPRSCDAPMQHENSNRCSDCGAYRNPVDMMMGAVCMKCTRKAHRQVVGKER
jgi:hypothetical protein